MKKEFVINRQGKDVVLYAGLLDLAHQQGLKRITTKLVQAPTEENGNLAICWAEVETAKGVFSGIGDACPQNVGRMIAMHTVRMAETRAKARALRDAVNVGTMSLEELGDADEDSSEEVPSRRAAAPRPLHPAPTPLRARQEAQASRPAPDGAASGEQLASLAKLQKACGQVVTIPADLSAADAAEQIRTLAQQFNAQRAK